MSAQTLAALTEVVSAAVTAAVPESAARVSTWRAAVRVALLGAAITACAAPPSERWTVRRAEQLHAEGRHEEALRMTDREIAWTSPSPGRRLVALHIAILRDLGRQSEGTAYDEFTQRFFAGEDTSRTDHALSRLDCGDRQPGFQLIHSWGKPEQGGWETGTIVATFAIDERGGIGAIQVLSARDPASAWAAIDAIARAKVRVGRVDELRADAGWKSTFSFARGLEETIPCYERHLKLEDKPAK